MLEKFFGLFTSSTQFGNESPRSIRSFFTPFAVHQDRGNTGVERSQVCRDFSLWMLFFKMPLKILDNERLESAAWLIALQGFGFVSHVNVIVQRFDPVIHL